MLPCFDVIDVVLVYIYVVVDDVIVLITVSRITCESFLLTSLLLITQHCNHTHKKNSPYIHATPLTCTQYPLPNRHILYHHSTSTSTYSSLKQTDRQTEGSTDRHHCLRPGYGGREWGQGGGEGDAWRQGVVGGGRRMAVCRVSSPSWNRERWKVGSWAATLWKAAS